MGKEELLDALAGLQAATSAEGLSDQFLVVHGGATPGYFVVSVLLRVLTFGRCYAALSDIERKRWKFLEDSCSVVLRRVFGLVAGAEDEDFGDFDTRPVHITTSEGINLCLKFLEPLIHSTLALVEQLEDEQEAVNQKCVLVAALLYVFAKDPGASEGAGLRSRLVTDVLMCGIDVHVIVATLRFREELVECRRLLLPSYESDSETESELVSDGDDSMLGDMGEFGAEDIQWIVEKVAKVWGLTKYQYFLQTTGQEYAFSAWSYHGIGNFTHELLTVQQQVLSMSLPVVSPLSWMFQISAYAHYMIYSEDHRVRSSVEEYPYRSETTHPCMCCNCCRNAFVALNFSKPLSVRVLRKSFCFHLRKEQARKMVIGIYSGIRLHVQQHLGSRLCHFELLPNVVCGIAF
ncbi:unnamed protein product [Phytophthora lilii]|uniref:Unnamed protein product n=1 Tax=Phytophthora lilii TaxID=2077276 RepID=A0A9W6UBA5_9STRA|nr:unnamed protein product [Phytophthora lilii]